MLELSNDSPHLFSLYFPHLKQVLSTAKSDNICFCKDAEFWHRIVSILRIQSEESIVLFDENQRAEVEILAPTYEKRRTVVFRVIEVIPIKLLQPSLVLACGLLKGSGFESVVYNATQMGVTQIVPLITKKVQREWHHKREHDRLKRVMIAAAEQSKQYALPELMFPQDLKTFTQTINQQQYQGYCKVLFETGGNPFFSLLSKLHTDRCRALLLLVLKEG